MSELTDRFKEEFKDKETRHIYADDFLNTFIATQLKVLREEREWTQKRLAEEADMRQERISVLEDVNYESWSVKTLKRLAKAFDLRLSIKFETFGSFLQDFDEFSHESLSRTSFDEDPVFKASEVTERAVVGDVPRSLGEFHRPALVAMLRPLPEDKPEPTTESDGRPRETEQATREDQEKKLIKPLRNKRNGTIGG